MLSQYEVDVNIEESTLSDPMMYSSYGMVTRFSPCESILIIAKAISHSLVLCS